jgi:predicted DNA-binding transcriptional regulator AlpA
MPLLTKAGLRQALGVGPKTLELWIASDPQFPTPAARDAHGRGQWDSSTITAFRKTVVDATEVATILGGSQTTLYARRRNDPNFPTPVFRNVFHMPPFWRRTDIEAYAKTAVRPSLKASTAEPSKVVNFSQFADLMGIKPPALHAQKQRDPSFPPPITSGRGALWARIDAETYREHRTTGATAPAWKRHKDPDLDLITLDEFATITGLSPGTMKVYKSLREPGFPAPAIESRYPVWRREDAIAFAKTRRATK